MPLGPRPRQLAGEVVQVAPWATDEDHPVFPVGSKPKRLLVCPQAVAEPFLIPGHKYLFKIASGWQAYQSWSEVIAYEIGKIVGLSVPPAFIALDARTGEMGVLVEFFYGYPGDATPPQFVHGSDLLQRLHPTTAFDPKLGRPHSVRTNLVVCRTLGVSDPIMWWGRTFTFDALIGNTDRHPENWGFLISRDTPSQVKLEMAPVFDNATSLGYERTDKSLEPPWSEDRVQKYIGKGTHHCGWLPDQRRGSLHLELCDQFKKTYSTASAEMKNVIRLADSEIDQILDWCTKFDVPTRVNGARAEFVCNLLKDRRDALRNCLGA
jgi:hypothetical protein